MSIPNEGAEDAALNPQNIAHCESGHLCQSLLFIMLLSWSTYIALRFS
jgi:hypothetical protein